MLKPEPLWQRAQLAKSLGPLLPKARDPLWHEKQLFAGPTLCSWATILVTCFDSGAPERTE